MKLKSIYLLLLLPVIWYSCANIIPLEGGPKDSTPPRMLKSVPDTFSLHFRNKKITLYFDEYVVIKNANKEVTVSPPVATPPIVQETGKSLEVIFQDTLAANTTYTIQFGNAITDNNEGNILKGYSFVFSTGDVLDSLSTGVTLLDAYTLKPVADAKWLLYKTMNDSTPYKENPYYLGYSNTSGNVNIGYMKGGSYYQFALVDQNNNSMYNTGEWIGFSDEMVVPGDSTDRKVYLFQELPEKNKLRSVQMLEKGKVSFKFITSPADVKIRPITDSLPEVKGNLESINENADSLIYWYPKITADTLYFEVTWPDQQTDTVRVTGKRNSKTTSGSTGKNKTTTKTPGYTPDTVKTKSGLELTTNLGSKHDYFKPIEINFSHPVKNADTSCIQLLEGNKAVSYRWKQADSVGRKYTISYNFRQGVNYTLWIRDSCIFDIWNMYNDSLKTTFKTSYDRDYARLTLKTTGVGSSENLVFILLDNDDKVLDKKTVVKSDGLHTAVFDNLPAGAYKVKIIYDVNGNGKWDTGNYLKKIQPEKVAYFPDNISIKPGFDAEFDWDVNAPPKLPEKRMLENKEKEIK